MSCEAPDLPTNQQLDVVGRRGRRMRKMQKHSHFLGNFFLDVPFLRSTIFITVSELLAILAPTKTRSLNSVAGVYGLVVSCCWNLKTRFLGEKAISAGSVSVFCKKMQCSTNKTPVVQFLSSLFLISVYGRPLISNVLNYVSQLLLWNPCFNKKLHYLSKLKFKKSDVEQFSSGHKREVIRGHGFTLQTGCS